MGELGSCSVLSEPHATPIDTESEVLMSLADAARTLPGGKVHVATVHRWRLRGVRGIKLETIMRGGIRFTSREALDRFFHATTAAAAGEPHPVRTPKQRSAEIAAAEREVLAA